jgi:D-3-phosphoglycerate dehydrogenase / 2-oxoglutarate reductase
VARFHVVYCGAINPPLDILMPVLEPLGVELVHANPRSGEETVAAAADADAIILHGSVPLPAEILQQLPRCRIIARTGVGVDRIDLEAAARQGLHITNAAGCNAIEVAEQTIGLMYTLARKLARMNTYVHDGRWQRHSSELHAYRGRVRRITGQTVGIVGLGHVGRQVAWRAAALGLRVLAVDPYLDAAEARARQAELTTLDAMLPQVDFLTLHAPLTDATYRLIGAARLAQMKPSAYLINCARGPLVDPEALYEALVAGRLAGAALDVTDPEPINVDNPLLTLDTVLVTAHTAANSDESFADCQRCAAEQVALVLSGQPPTNPIDDPWLRRSTVETTFGGV